MPEIKNTFLKGKMNKSLDDRLLPPGEYRDAVNVQITKSDTADVGTAHNIKGDLAVGNVFAGFDFDVIGNLFDNKNNRIFYFLTDSNTSHKIYMYDTETETSTLLMDQSFLNFHKDYLITGVNLVDGLLFWTDNRNQPRRINVVKAISNSSFYDSEVKISVAKYAPYLPPFINEKTYDPEIASDRLKLEFPRFAYRYKYEDNEYSLISPFTQVVFEIGNQGSANNIMTEEQIIEAFESTENIIMQNRINKIKLDINVPSATPTTSHQIVDLEILYKEADSTAVRVIETIPISDSSSFETVNGLKYYRYTYNSSPPRSTLAEKEVLRVADIVPKKAQAQEFIENAIVYGNFTEGHDIPEIDYSLILSEKIDTSEYLHLSLKQRRTYEVGIVLMDLYGRQSPVILHQSSSITVAAKSNTFNSLYWNGDSLKVIFNADIPNAYDVNTNPLGWYSYKIVVKQQEQDYYNVYSPGILKSNQTGRDHITLHGDNINKVPRDTTSSLDSDGLLPSASRLYPKIINESDETTGLSDGDGRRLNNGELIKVTSIGTLIDHGLFDIDNVFATSKYFGRDENKQYLIGELEKETEQNSTGWLDPTAIGVDYFKYRPELAVFETEPFVSSLDIYYETSTAGLVSDINDDNQDLIIDGFEFEASDYGVAPVSGADSKINLQESVVSGSYIGIIRGYDGTVELPSTTFTINGITDPNGAAANDSFIIEQDTSDYNYKIKTNTNFLRSPIGSNTYTFDITASFGGNTHQETNNVVFIFEALPTISIFKNKAIAKNVGAGTLVGTITGTNGSASTANSPQDNLTSLAFSITSQTYADGSALPPAHNTPFILDSYVSNSGTIDLLSQNNLANYNADDIIRVTIRVTDGGGGFVEDFVDITVLASGGANSTTLSYNSNSNAYSSSDESCLNYTIFPDNVTIYHSSTNWYDSGSVIYRGSSLESFAGAGWYSDGSYSGKWTVQNGTAYWLVAPTACST